MKKLILAVFLLLGALNLHAENNSVGLNNNDDRCIILPNETLKKDIIYDKYKWRKIYKLYDFQNYVMRTREIEYKYRCKEPIAPHKCPDGYTYKRENKRDCRCEININPKIWNNTIQDYVNITPKYPFKLTEGNFKNNRVRLTAKDIKSGDAHKLDVISGFTNNKEIPFKDSVFEITFDYYSYGGTNGSMGLILYDGDQAIPVLSNDAGSVGYNPVKSNKGHGPEKVKTDPFSTVQKIYGENRVEKKENINCADTSKDPKYCYETSQNRKTNSGWLAIQFNENDISITNSSFNTVMSKKHNFKSNKDGLFGRFRIKIDNTNGKSLLTILREDVSQTGESIWSDNKTFLKDFDLMQQGQRTPPETIKITFSAATIAYSDEKTQEIGNVTTCPPPLKNNISFKVVEREFAKFYEENKDKTINGVKYDFNWLWNSPLRTRIAGGAPKKPYEKNDKNIGYEYCVIASKDKGKTPASYKDGIYLSYAKANRNKEIIKELLALKDGEELSMNKYFLKEEYLTKTTKKNLADAKLVYSNEKELKLDIKADKSTSACFTLHKDFTKENITSHMIFNVYKNDDKMLTDTDTDTDFKENQGKTNASNNAFAIRPAGFYAEFTPKIYDGTNHKFDKDDEIALPNKNYLKENIDTNETSYITYPLRDINSTATLHADKIYEVDIFPVALNITKKTDEKSKDPKYTYNLEKLEKTYINTFDTSKENLEAILPNKAGCSDENNITLGKITNKERSRFIFQDGSINYENYLSDLTETITNPIFATQPKLYLKHNNVMKFLIKAYDMGWTYANYRDIYRYNKNKSRDEKDKLTKSLQKYGFQCKFDKNDEIYKDFKNIANKKFEDELVSCKTEFINPNLIEFIPNTFDIYLTRILNQSNTKSGGFTYYNDLMSEIKDHTQIYTENQMSAKLQLIIAASDGKGNAYSNFTNKCYAKDVIFKLSYIGDRNFKYKKEIEKNDITGLSEKEKKLMQNVINVFNKNPDIYTENKEFVAGNINQKTEFESYMKYKEKTILSDEIKKILEKKSISEDEEKMLNTAKISFNVDGFYQYNKNLASDKFCKDLNDTEKCLIKIISSHGNEDDIKADMDKNLNKYRNSYKAEMIKDGSSWREFDFDKFDEASVNIQISKNFFNDEIKFIDKDYEKAKLERPGATAVMVGFNLGRDKNPMNPTKVFIRDFIPSSLWTVLDENRLQVNNTKIIKNPYNKEIKPVVHYNKHNNNQSGLFYYGSAYANDAKGPRKGVNNKVYYATYCKKEKNDCNEFGISTSYENTVPIILNWYKSHDYTPSKTTDDGDILKFIPNSKDETTTVTTKTNILDKDGTQPIKTTPKNNTITEDTITMETPSYLRYHEKFHVEFIKENKNTWFGEGGAGKDRDSKKVGNVLGTGENKDGKFDKNLNKESNRVFW